MFIIQNDVWIIGLFLSKAVILKYKYTYKGGHNNKLDNYIYID